MFLLLEHFTNKQDRSCVKTSEKKEDYAIVAYWLCHYIYSPTNGVLQKRSIRAY